MPKGPNDNGRPAPDWKVIKLLLNFKTWHHTRSRLELGLVWLGFVLVGLGFGVWFSRGLVGLWLLGLA